MFSLTEVGIPGQHARPTDERGASNPGAATATQKSSGPLNISDTSTYIDTNDFLDRMIRVPAFSCQYPKLAAATIVNDLRICDNDKTAAQLLLAVRNAYRIMPAAMLETNVVDEITKHLHSRSKLCRACAAAALAAMTALPQARGSLATKKDIMERLIAMLRCGIHSMDATTASLVIANSMLSQRVREQLTKPKIIRLLVSLVRQAVSAPVVDESESDHNHLLDMMGMERPLVTKILSKPAALNAAAALCHMAQHDPAREMMAQVGLMEVLFDAHHGQNQNPLKERCKMLLNLLLVHRMDAVPFVSKWYETCKSRSVSTMVKELGLEVEPEVSKLPARQEAASGLPTMTRTKTLEDAQDKRELLHSKSKSIYDLVYG